MTTKDDDKAQVSPDDEGRLLDHDYDGIRELDHPLPNWWLMIFYATIIFSIAYVGYYWTGLGRDGYAELAVAMRDIEARRPKEEGSETGGDALLLAALKDQSRITSGRAIYQSKCAACHGASAEGGIGPNLTDDYWIHGQGRPQDIFTTVRKGVAEKGMPPWADLLKAEEQIEVTAFIRSVHGTNPPGAKAAQGEIHEFKEF